MQLRTLALATAVGTLAPLAAPLMIAPTVVAATETNDIVYMDDGRVLHGRILSETSSHIVFELVDRAVGITATVTLAREHVMKVDRGVPVEGAGAPAKAAEDMPEPEPVAKPADSSSSTSDGVARVCVVTMKGQMGTDIAPGIFKEVAAELKAVKPTLIVFKMDCSDLDDLMIPKNRMTEVGLLAFDEYRELVNVLKDDLRGIPQVMWVKDAVGISSMIALAWKDLYMMPTARLAGMNYVIEGSGAQKWSDEDIRAKMTAAYLGYANGFLEYGGYDIKLGKAMMLPEYSLSASFEGRQVVWRLDADGQYLVDNDKEKVPMFRARMAENLGLSKGTVDDLDDLLFLLGYREYKLIEGKAAARSSEFSKEWRKALSDSRKAWDEYEQFTGWARGADAIKYLGQAKSRLNQIINLVRRYKAVEIRWQIERGVQLRDLVILEEQLTEQLTALRRGRTGGGSGSGRGGAGFGG